MHLFSFPRVLLITAASAGLAACGGNAPTLTVPVSAPNAYLLTTDDSIVGVDLDSMEFARNVRGIPRATTANTAGALDPTEVIQDIDYRNSEGALYALTKTGTQGRIIRIDPNSGTFIRLSTLVSDGTTTQIALTDTSYTIDFNPVVDRLRVIGSNGANLRVDVSTGDTATDSNIAAGNTITGAAYEDTFTSTGRGTRLFTLDSSTTNDRVNLQNPPNDGTQSDPKSLLGSTNVDSIDGYDINPVNNAGLALLTVGGAQQFYNINPGVSGGANAATFFAAPPRLTGSIKYKAFTFITTANPTVTALTSSNKIHTFRANQPNDVSNAADLSGLAVGEKVIGIDFRQSDRTLYALSDASKIYSVATNGTLTNVRTLGTLLNGATQYTLDFNPLTPTGSTQNRLRLIGADRSNAVVNVEDGVVSGNSAVTGTPAPVVKAAAYFNNFRTSTVTSLLVIDRASSSLNTQDFSTTPSQGALTRLSTLGITLDPSSPVGFDISGRNNENQLLMARTADSGNFSLYRVNTSATTSPLTLVGTLASSSDFIDIAIRF
jgi:hypothetical protein